MLREGPRVPSGGDAQVTDGPPAARLHILGPMAGILHVDVAVIGGGIGGISVASELATDRSVVVIEAEREPGHHATGRSAASYVPSYGPPTVRRLTAASFADFHVL